MAAGSATVSQGVEVRSIPQGAVVLLGRLFFVLIFLMAGPNHFSKQTIAFSASQGVPFASITVPLSGTLALAGGLSVLLGYRAKIGAWLIALFLVPCNAHDAQVLGRDGPDGGSNADDYVHEERRHFGRRVAHLAVWSRATQP